MKRVGCAAVIGGALFATVLAADVETVFARPRTFSLDLAEGGTTCERAFDIPGFDSWSRPWTLRVSFSYRTEGVETAAAALKIRGVGLDGRPAPMAMWPDTFTGRRDETYVLSASDAFRAVMVDVQIPGIIWPRYRLEWEKRFGREGRAEIRDVRVELVRRTSHRFEGGEYRISPKWEKNFILKNIFFAETGTVEVAFAFPERRPVCTARVLDVKGRTRWTVAGTNGRARVTFPTRGYWDIEAVADYPDGARVCSTGCVAVCGTPISDEAVRGSRYGMMVVLGGNALWRKLGARWDQKFVMIDQEHRSFDLPDETTEVFFNFNAGLVPPSLLRPDHRGRSGCFPPADWEAYRAFCGQWLDEHPAALKRTIGLTGELDFQWRGTDAEYVRMCRIFTEEARRRNPDFFACGPTASRIKVPYLRRLHREGFFDFLSGVSLHHYVDGTKPEGEYWEDVQNLFSFLDEKGVDLPVYLTETGWTVGAGRYFVPVSRENQARYLTRALALLSTVRVKGIVWFVDFTMLDEFGAIRNAHEAAFPKPMLQAFATVTRNLSDVTAEMTLRRLDEETYLVSGRKKDGRWVHVLWRARGSAARAWPAVPLAAEDYLGVPVARTESVAVSEDPVYFFSSADYAGDVWTPPPGGVKKEASEKRVVPAWTVSAYEAGGAKSAAQAKPVPSALWKNPKTAPQMRLAYGREGIVVEMSVADARHRQPYSRERLPEGDALTLAFDVDKPRAWLANEVFMCYKGHRCVEYSVALRDDGTTEVFRRNCWIPDRKGFESVGSNVRAKVSRQEGRTVYWIWIPWANLGLDEQLRAGSCIGFSAAVYEDGQAGNTLFGGICPPLDPMKYGTILLD